MPKAIRIHAHGGPEVLTFEDYDPGSPKAGEARIRQTAIGVNFLDCYYRMGTYPAPNGLPLVVGSEAAGEVTGVKN
jgi:NADPH2:quinone reductase